jgi:hypothetical protein
LPGPSARPDPKSTRTVSLMLAIDHRMNQCRQITTAMRFAEGLLKESAVGSPLAAADGAMSLRQPARSRRRPTLVGIKEPRRSLRKGLCRGSMRTLGGTCGIHNGTPL